MRMLVAGILFLGLGLVGCDSTPTSTEPEHVGRYDLVSINGAPLPWTADQRDDDLIQVIAANLNLTALGTYTDSMFWRITEAGEVTIETEWSSGNYSRAGDVLTFVSGANTHTASFSAGTITVDLLGAVTVYHRRADP